MKPFDNLGRMYLLRWLLLLVLASSSVSFIRNDSTKLQASTSTDQCALYIAPSTIPNAGLGIFTAIPLEHGQTIGNGDVLIPIIDMDLYMRGRFEWMVDDYTWNGESCGMTRESKRDGGVSGLGPGLDGAINCHLALVNVEASHSQWDDAGLHRSRNPGAGAFSPYYNASTFTVANIPAGGELFKFYGEHWFHTRPNEFRHIPLPRDYSRANRLLRRFHSLFLKSQTLSSDIKQSMYSLIKTIPLEGRVLNALPSYEDVSAAVVNGIESLHQPGATRSLAELAQVGRCLDNIKPGRSTLHEAGRGAFATKHLAKGSVITGSPLFHIPYDAMLVMHDYKDDIEQDDYVILSSNILGYQLLLNYCWGHAESTVLLCAYSAGVNFINHNQTLVNVGIQWAPDGQLSHNATWLEQSSVTDIASEFSTKFGIDFVALRDIAPGEELFLDYGDAWEHAWSWHVQTWRQRQQDMLGAEYVSAMEYNRLFGAAPIRTLEEQRTNPYPYNLELRCHLDAEEDSITWVTEHRVKSIKQWQLDDVGYECDVLERKQLSTEFVYTVALKNEDGTKTIVRGLTRDYFAFLDHPYTTDIHLPWAFRHKMMMPDIMIPRNWRNLVSAKLRY